MKRRKRIQSMQALLDRGVSRQEIFDQFFDEGEQDKIAFEVASLPDEVLCEQYRARIFVLVSFLLIHALMAGFGAWHLLAPQGESVVLGGVIGSIIIPLGLAYGVYQCDLVVYNALLVLAGIGLGRAFMMLSDIPAVPPGRVLFDIFWIGCIATLAWHLRSKLFPHYGPIGLKRDDSGTPVFKSEYEVA